MDIVSIDEKNTKEPSKAINSFTTDLIKGDLIDIRVGNADAAQVLKAHATLLEHVSPFFKAALKRCWNKGQGTIELPDHCPTGFSIFLVWCYRGHLPTDFDIFANGVLQIDFLQAYKIGHYLQTPYFLDLMMSKLLYGFHEVDLVAGIHVLVKVYDLDLEGTKLLDFIVNEATYHFMKAPERHCQQGDRSEDMDRIVERPGLARLFLDQICLFNKSPWTPTDIRSNHCQWHEHPNTEKCPVHLT